MTHFKIAKIEKSDLWLYSTAKVIVDGEWYDFEYSPLTRTLKNWEFTPEFCAYLSACMNFGWTEGTFYGEIMEEFPF